MLMTCKPRPKRTAWVCALHPYARPTLENTNNAVKDTRHPEHSTAATSTQIHKKPFRRVHSGTRVLSQLYRLLQYHVAYL